MFVKHVTQHRQLCQNCGNFLTRYLEPGTLKATEGIDWILVSGSVDSSLTLHSEREKSFDDFPPRKKNTAVTRYL